MLLRGWWLDAVLVPASKPISAASRWMAWAMIDRSPSMPWLWSRSTERMPDWARLRYWSYSCSPTWTWKPVPASTDSRQAARVASETVIGAWIPKLAATRPPPIGPLEQRSTKRAFSAMPALARSGPSRSVTSKQRTARRPASATTDAIMSRTPSM